MEKGFVPLSDIQGQNREGLTVTLPPDINPEQVGVNVPLIHTLMRLSGIGTLKITTYQGERSKLMATVGSTFGDGSSVFGGAISRTKVDQKEITFRNHTSELPFPITWADAEIAINVAELRNQLSDQDVSNNIHSWTRIIDRVVREGILEIGFFHLNDNLKLLNSSVFFGDFALRLFLSSVTKKTIIYDLKININPMILLGLVFTVTGIGFHAISASPFRDNPVKLTNQGFEGYRFSFFPEFQIDRLLAVYLLTSLGELIKSIET